MKLRRAFTLIELLVAIAIIGVLIAILLPQIGKVKRKARTAQCLTNLHGFGEALQTYINDWGKIFPFTDKQETSWTQLMMNGGKSTPGAPVVGTGGYGVIEKLRICPEALKPNTTGTNAGFFNIVFGNAHAQWNNSPLTGAGISSSYGINGWLYNYGNTSTTADSTNFGGTSALTLLNQLASINDPNLYHRVPGGIVGESRIPAFADANWRHTFPQSFDQKPVGLSGKGSLDDPGPFSAYSTTAPVHPLARVTMNRHDMAVNLVFVDSHAETVKLSDLWAQKWNAKWLPPSPLPKIP